ncbi:hypothetical protein BN1095_4280002 [Clostridioides difficile]|uniref:Uncharacterized protein n=1 Tax=Clostridioides difficile TaxID=1496 RepID=A0A069AWL3_CLODI|nr:hypothetical protein BN1095_4280002 [Clostridioides difficile]
MPWSEKACGTSNCRKPATYAKQAGLWLSKPTFKINPLPSYC